MTEKKKRKRERERERGRGRKREEEGNQVDVENQTGWIMESIAHLSQRLVYATAAIMQ